MTEQPSPRSRVAKGAALVCSSSLGLLVIVNAQFGCDSPSATAPEDSKPVTAEPAPQPANAAQADPTAPNAVNAAPAPAPATRAPANANEPVNAEPKPVEDQPKHEDPVLMPASKSGGDFGAMRFPGQAPTQQAPQQNPAPNQAK